MKTFHCAHCRQLIFFENTRCIRCGHTLAYLPHQDQMLSLNPAGEGLWRPAGIHSSEMVRLCKNYLELGACNWAIPSDEASSPYCLSCRLTRTIPNLVDPAHVSFWCRLEAAKRRLLRRLINLGLLLETDGFGQSNLAFEFLADDLPCARRILTGHQGGLVTINIREADDVQREQQRVLLHEPYRTVLGHLRHETGHYYWSLLIETSPRLKEFRELFGDERLNYNQAILDHYYRGAPADWTNRWISAYASSHPWEDWAESWAHYLHMVDVLEIVRACGVSLAPARDDEPVLKAIENVDPVNQFDEMINAWFPTVYLINNLNRDLGLADGYPFVLSPAAITKLRFIHNTILHVRQSGLPRMISDPAAQQDAPMHEPCS